MSSLSLIARRAKALQYQSVRKLFTSFVCLAMALMATAVIKATPAAADATLSNVRTWGFGDYTGTNTHDGSSFYSPTLVPSQSYTTQVSAGGDAMYVLHADSTVSAWGRNDYGQLGLGNTNYGAGFLPARPILPPVVAVSGGGSGYALALDGGGQQSQMLTAVTAHAGSWNIVSASGGANDAGFKARLLDFYDRTNGQPWSVLSIDRPTCPDTDTLDADINRFGASVKMGLTSLFAQARIADSNVRRMAITYPYVMSADATCQVNSTTYTPYIGAGQAIDDLDQYIMSLTTDGVTVVDLRVAAGFGGAPMNDIQLTRYFGYPHPNSAGQLAIATAVLNSIP